METRVKRLAVVSGTRAEYGVLRPLLRLARESRVLDLRIVAAGMHLLPEHGYTLAEVEADGYAPLYLVHMGQPGVFIEPERLATGIGEFARVFADIRPNLVLVEGDRVEALAAALAAGYMGIPLAHDGGGVVTGTVDNAARHAISQFADLHFVELDEARGRLIAHGRDPEAIHVVGALGIDAITQMEWRSRESVLADLGLPLDSRYLLVTFHPESEHPEMAGEWMGNLLRACYATGLSVVVTYPNSDPGSAAIIAEIERAQLAGGIRAFQSLGSDRYLHAMKYADAVVGNSSSGLIEAPSLQVPVVNVGHRQADRPAALNVVDCTYSHGDISHALDIVLHDEHFRSRRLPATFSPYGDGHAAERIMVVLEGRLVEINSLPSVPATEGKKDRGWIYDHAKRPGYRSSAV